MNAKLNIAKLLPPEDVRAGDYVALLQVTYEFPSFFWSGDACTLPPDEPVRIGWTPACGGIPLKVKQVCLPFVFVRSPYGESQTLDVRQCRLARLDRKYGKTVWKSIKKKA